MKENISLVMDVTKNPLKSLPKTQSFQIMVLLSIMWSSVFCVAFGSWFWWGELVIGHVAFVLAIFITSLTFSGAKKRSHRDMYRSKDGTTRYDDLWGG